MITSTNPYLNFDGNAQQAFDHYRVVFGGDFGQVVRYRDFPGNMGVGEADLDKLAHIALPLGAANVLMGTDVAGERANSFRLGTNYYIHLEAASADEAQRVFDGLAKGGRTDMPLTATEWAERYGICVDRFGVQWMVSYTGDVKFSG